MASWLRTGSVPWMGARLTTAPLSWAGAWMSLHLSLRSTSGVMFAPPTCRSACPVPPRFGGGAEQDAPVFLWASANGRRWRLGNLNPVRLGLSCQGVVQTQGDLRCPLPFGKSVRRLNAHQQGGSRGALEDEAAGQGRHLHVFRPGAMFMAGGWAWGRRQGDTIGDLSLLARGRRFELCEAIED